jgi:hypothetical protein
VARCAPAQRVPEFPHRRCGQYSAVFHPLKLNALDKKTRYVVCCDTGRRSSAAAYILSERGFEAYVLKGGLAGTEAARASQGCVQALSPRLHRVRRLVAAERAGQVILDLSSACCRDPGR